MRDIRAFSLIEMLVGMAVVAILAAILLPVLSSMQASAKATRELSGARQAITAWINYAGDSGGEVMPGYKAETDVFNADGEELRFPVSARYVFRLAPYLDYRLHGTLLVNKQEKVTSDYAMSVSPSFGVNLTFVGGDFGGGSDLKPNPRNFASYGKFVVTSLAEIHSPAKLIVFASARFDSDGEVVEGYNAVRSPNFRGRRWPSEYDIEKPWYSYGMLHLRHRGRAVCAMADGHVELLSFEQLEDMRRWSNQAAQEDDPNWTLTNEGHASL